MAGPVLHDPALYIQAGFGKNGLPVAAGKQVSKECFKKQLRIADEQEAVNRFTWYNIPCDLTGAEIERMIYYKGQLCFFYDKNLEKFFFTPYALNGTIDFYGRYNSINPVPWTSGTDDKLGKAQAQYLSGLKLKCVYGIKQEDEINEDLLFNSAVLLHDYSKQLSQTIIPRQQINDGLLDVMAECIPMLRTSLMSSCGIKGMRVNDADQEQNVREASYKVKDAALTGDIYIPFVGNVDFQELTSNNTTKPEEYLLTMQSLDNFRLSTYGIENGGLFRKKVQELQSEADINKGSIGLILQDGLSIRQNFCNIVNSIWDLGIWCEPSQNLVGQDITGDGYLYDRNVENEDTELESTEVEKVEENV